MRKLIWITSGFLLFAIGAAAILTWRYRDINERTRKWVEQQLSDRLHSQVELASWDVQMRPGIRIVGSGLTIYYHGRRDVPPLIQIGTLSFDIGLMSLINLPRHIERVRIDKMTITVPRGDDKDSKPPEPQPVAKTVAQKKSPPAVIVDEIVCTDTLFVMLPKRVDKDPLDWDIHNLTLHDVGAGKPFSFTGTLTNAKPVGEIATHGDLGPWNADDPGKTPVSGAYEFTNADLGPFAGVGGILSSTGEYSGPLDELQVAGKTDMQDFSLDQNGTPVLLHTEYSATVDGTDGDTYLHPVRATLIQTPIIANGSIARVPDHKGRLISLDASIPNGRIEDVLRLVVKIKPNEQPLLMGPVNLTTKITVPPGKQKVIEKLILDGQFSLPSARWGSLGVKQKLESLSRHALGTPGDEDAGSSVTNLHSRFHLQNGALRLTGLSFAVPGATIALDGTYNIRTEEMDFQGTLRMQAKLSQSVTGVKSVFLKVFDPFFAKDGAGAVIPIRISGTREAPKFGLALFGNKKPAGNKSTQAK